MDSYAFRQGFARAMVDISAYGRRLRAEDVANILEDHTESWGIGYRAALDHFEGFSTHGTELAHSMGLHHAYEGFYGQLSWEHPIVLPGHAPIR